MTPLCLPVRGSAASMRPSPIRIPALSLRSVDNEHNSKTPNAVGMTTGG